MCIISGRLKGRRLASPPGDEAGVRPTSGRTREALFSTLSSLVDFDGMSCLDLFCGTGSFGLECISRGAEYCTFVDISIKLAEENIRTTGAEEQTDVVRYDAVKFLKNIDHNKYDIVFADPPYKFIQYSKILEPFEGTNALVILEHKAGKSVKEGFEKYVIKEKESGAAGFTFFDFSNKDDNR